MVVHCHQGEFEIKRPAAAARAIFTRPSNRVLLPGLRRLLKKFVSLSGFVAPFGYRAMLDYERNRSVLVLLVFQILWENLEVHVLNHVGNANTHKLTFQNVVID